MQEVTIKEEPGQTMNLKHQISYNDEIRGKQDNGEKKDFGFRYSRKSMLTSILNFSPS